MPPDTHHRPETIERRIAFLNGAPKLAMQAIGNALQHAAGTDPVYEQGFGHGDAMKPAPAQADVEFPIFVALAHGFIIAASRLPGGPAQEQTVGKLVEEKLGEEIVILVKDAASFTGGGTSKSGSPTPKSTMLMPFASKASAARRMATTVEPPVDSANSEIFGDII